MTFSRRPQILRRSALRWLACCAFILCIVTGIFTAPSYGQATRSPASTSDAAVTTIPFADANPILERFRDKLPAALKAKKRTELESLWPSWVGDHNARIRARLERGDEESIINFLAYGTSFTTQPRLTSSVARGSSEQRLLQARVEDLIAGIERPGANERLQFAREVVDRKGIDPATVAGKEQLRRYLLEARTRMLTEYADRTRMLDSSKLLPDPRAEIEAYFTLFRDRGLSSDTLLSSSFSIEMALDAFKPKLGALRARRVAIVGPGLDFTDKAEGYDFYPQQTIQPFALIDSLIRLGLAEKGDLRLTTLDVSPRINRHITTALERARAGAAYVLQLPLDRDARWQPALVAYWERFGDRIGAALNATAAPSTVGNVQVRAVTVRPDVVQLIDAQTVNIVLERLEPLAADEQFDLIIGTNILIYYDGFEQNLALANAARMLRSGGFFVSNTLVSPAVPLKLLDDYYKVVHRDSEGDRIFFYQRQ